MWSNDRKSVVGTRYFEIRRTCASLKRVIEDVLACRSWRRLQICFCWRLLSRELTPIVYLCHYTCVYRYIVYLHTFALTRRFCQHASCDRVTSAFVDTGQLQWEKKFSYQITITSSIYPQKLQFERHSV